MTATRAQITEYARKTSLVSEAAQREMEAAYNAIASALSSGSIDYETAAELLSDTLLSVSSKYGTVSSALASELYQQLLYEGTGEEREIALADPATAEDADSALSEILQGAGSLLAALLGKTDQLVKQAGRDTMANAIAQDADTGVKWARVPVGPTCAFCTMLASRGFVYESETSAGGNGNDYHAKCVVGETKVSGTSLNACLRRDYEGPLVSITTCGGRNVSVTPEHPILTARGWVCAAEIEDTDALLCCFDGDGKKMGVPDVDDVYPSAKEVFEAAGFLNPFGALSVPASTEHLNGETGSCFDVNVVNVYGLLKRAGASHGGKPFEHEPFAVTGGFDGSLSLVGSRSSDLAADGGWLSTDRIMCRSGLGAPFFGGHFGCSDDACAGTAADRYPRLFEPSTDDTPADVAARGKFEDAFATLVSFHDAGWRGNPLASWLDSVAMKHAVKIGRADAGFLDDLASFHPGKIQLDDVAFIETRDAFVGHVYNLSTDGGWFLSNGIITHNCDCQIIPSWEESPTVDGYDYMAMRAVYNHARDDVVDDARSKWQEMNEETRLEYKGKTDAERYNNYLTKRTLSAMRSLDSSLSDAHVGA